MQAANSTVYHSHARTARRSRRRTTAPVAALRPPHMARSVAEQLRQQVQGGSFDRWAEQRRVALANLLGVACQVGALAPSDIAAALSAHDGLQLHALAEKAIDGIGAWMVSRSKDASGKPFPYKIELFITPDDAPEIALCADVMTWSAPLSVVPEELARIAYAAIRCLSDYIPVALPHDVIGHSYWFEEQVEAIDALREAGLLDKPEEAYELAQASYEFASMMEAEEFEHFLKNHADWTADGFAWTASEGFDDEGDREAWLVSTIWRLRRESPALYRHPLMGVVRRLMLFVRRQQRINARIGVLQAGEYDEGDAYFGFAATVLLGYAWEGTAVDSLYQGFMEVGESPTVRWPLDGLAIPQLCNTLGMLAQGFGLLNLLEITLSEV